MLIDQRVHLRELLRETGGGRRQELDVLDALSVQRPLDLVHERDVVRVDRSLDRHTDRDLALLRLDCA